MHLRSPGQPQHLSIITLCSVGSKETHFHNFHHERSLCPGKGCSNRDLCFVLRELWGKNCKKQSRNTPGSADVSGRMLNRVHTCKGTLTLMPIWWSYRYRGYRGSILLVFCGSALSARTTGPFKSLWLIHGGSSIFLVFAVSLGSHFSKVVVIPKMAVTRE